MSLLCSGIVGYVIWLRGLRYVSITLTKCDDCNGGRSGGQFCRRWVMGSISNVCGALWALVLGWGRSLYGLLASDLSWGTVGVVGGTVGCPLCGGLGYTMPWQRYCRACFGSGTQHRCPGCGEPFIYFPDIEPVILDGGVYWHKGCWPGVGGLNSEAPPSEIPGKSAKWGAR